MKKVSKRSSSKPKFNPSSAPTSVEQIIGRRVRIVGDHPWAGESAEVVGFDDRMGLRVKLLRMDAMYGHECFIDNPRNFRAERKGIDW